ncbi:hypothetical protein [Aestuariivivens sediminis]|uniref:hypothetical protein n=1 Tax=Aestuariivivens sediminis TaxID=2913557 RepID=UPI001F56CB3C|nr:hypothetical protein [Aestuariivivens sediminis]
MKKAILFFTLLSIGLVTVSATNSLDHSVGQVTINSFNNFSEPVVFMERGVEFLIFPDGSFDFDANKYHSYNVDIYYKKRSKRAHINMNHVGPNVNMGYTPNRNNDVFISRDLLGRVRRVDNVLINYDRTGKVTRIGSVFITYGRGRNGTLTQVGGLHVNYNRWGEIVSSHGRVNPNNYCNICGVNSCHMSHSSGIHSHEHNDWKDNNDTYYYYKDNGKLKKRKR